MEFSDWMEFVLSCGVTAVNWLRYTEIQGISILYILLGLFVMGVVISAIPFRS